MDNNTVTTEQGRHCIVLLCGQKGSGKSTLARALVEKYKFVEYAYASALKDLVSAVYQWPRA
jgi:polynucleotide 5'-kinase involved in rRNA processing